MDNSNNDIKKSPNDQRTYKNLFLSNGLQCIIISDPGKAISL